MVGLQNNNRLVAATLGVLCVLLVLAIAKMQISIIRADRLSSEAVQQSNARARTLSEYFVILQDVETGQRGYVVTGNPDFLEPMKAGLARVAEVGTRLRQQYAAGSKEAVLAEHLLMVGAAKVRHARVVADLRARGQTDEAAAMIRNLSGKRLMDDVRRKVAALQEAERNVSRAILLASAVDHEQRRLRVIAAEMALLLTAGALFTLLLLTLTKLDRTSRTRNDYAARQQAIFDHASDAMLMLDQEGMIISVNAAAERLFGRSAEELVGQSNLSLFADPPPVEVSRAYLKGLIAGEASANPVQNFIGRRGDGTEFETEVVTTPVPLHDGLQFLAVGRDSTERRQVERMKSEFVATVSHELRTPLASISGSLGLLAGNPANELPAGARRLVEIALNNSHRLIRLINDMLDLEKIESNRMELREEAVDLRPLLERVIEENDGFAARHRIDVHLVSVPPRACVLADPDRMVQVFTNLLSNAIKFSPKGEQVDVRVVDAGTAWRISVEDHGPGIPEAFRNRIFGKFAQADGADARIHGGSGLGLSIVKEIVARTGGTVSFDSELGRGTRFHVDLPKLQTPAPADEAPVQQQPIADDGRRHFLHIEDDADALRVVGEAFAHIAEVHFSPSFAEAKAALRRFRFDAVLLDVALADGSGLDLVPLIRETSPGAPVILYTATDLGAAEVAMVDVAGVKSRTSLAELVARVEELIGVRAEAETRA